MSPFSKIKKWLDKEQLLGVPAPNSVVLSTVSNNIPHSRVVAIREIKNESLIFFTSKQTKKVIELLQNPLATMNFSLSMQERQIVLEGHVHLLTNDENQKYWNDLPRERQLRFATYAPFSGQEINNHNALTQLKQKLDQDCMDGYIPMSEFYMGFCFIPQTILFYTSKKEDFSEVIQFNKKEGSWEKQLLSP